MINSSDNKRVLALMPHPDDIEILCAGTLLRLQALGYAIHLVTMTPGDKGSATLSRNEISTVRRDEAKTAARILNAASYRCLEFSDLEICFDVPSRRRIAGLLREIDPLVVFTTPPADYMFDHEITSQLVRDACFNAGCPNYPAESKAPPIKAVPYLYYADAIGGHDIYGANSRFSVVIDISNQIERKCTALEAHDSQRKWLQKQHGMDDYVESMRLWNAQRGAQIGVAFAEAFQQHLGHPHAQNDFLREQLDSSSIR